MAEKKTKIQPAVGADTQVGQAPDGATDIQEITAEQIAGMKPEEVMAYVSNAKKFIATATQKSQEAAEVKRQNEQLRARSEYWEKQAEQMQDNLRKVVEQMTVSQQPTQSSPSQPPDFDEYDPKGSWQKLQKWNQDQLKLRDSKYDELADKFKGLEESTNVGLRQINIERYLEKAIPKDSQVDAREILLYYQMNPQIEPTMDNLNQAIKERQSVIDERAKVRMEQMIAEKEAAIAKVQDAEGSAPFAGDAPDLSKFADSTPAEKHAKVADFFNKSLKASGGGG